MLGGAPTTWPLRPADPHLEQPFGDPPRAAPHLPAPPPATTLPLRSAPRAGPGIFLLPRARSFLSAACAIVGPSTTRRLTMVLRWYTLVIDCHDVRKQASWWAEAIGWKTVIET